MDRAEIVAQYGHHTMTLVPHMVFGADGTVDIDRCKAQVTVRDIPDRNAIQWSQGFTLSQAWACMDMFKVIGVFEVV